MSQSTDHNLDPVRKTRSVPIDPDEAFVLFTDRMEDWWPLSAHSVSGSVEAGITVGSATGTRVVESHAGANHIWAEILVHEPGRRIVLAWHPGGPPQPASQLDVRFDAIDDGTAISVIHAGWERYGDVGADKRRQYEVGWDGILAKYVEAARAAATI